MPRKCGARIVCQAPSTANSASLRAQSDRSSTGMAGQTSVATLSLCITCTAARTLTFRRVRAPVSAPCPCRSPPRRVVGSIDDGRPEPRFGENRSAAARAENFSGGLANRDGFSGFVLRAAESAARRRGPDPPFLRRPDGYGRKHSCGGQSTPMLACPLWELEKRSGVLSSPLRVHGLKIRDILRGEGFCGSPGRFLC